MTIVQSLVLHTTQQKDATVEHIMTPIQVILTRNWLFMCNEDLKQTWTLNIWECWGYSIILEFPLKNSFLTTDYPVCLFKEEMHCLKKVKGQSLHVFLVVIILFRKYNHILILQEITDFAFRMVTFFVVNYWNYIYPQNHGKQWLIEVKVDHSYILIVESVIWSFKSPNITTQFQEYQLF